MGEVHSSAGRIHRSRSVHGVCMRLFGHLAFRNLTASPRGPRLPALAATLALAGWLSPALGQTAPYLLPYTASTYAGPTPNTPVPASPAVPSSLWIPLVTAASPARSRSASTPTMSASTTKATSSTLTTAAAPASSTGSTPSTNWRPSRPEHSPPSSPAPLATPSATAASPTTARPTQTPIPPPASPTAFTPPACTPAAAWPRPQWRRSHRRLQRLLRSPHRRLHTD